MAQETTAIPVRGPLAEIGAAAYIAVLAYPESHAKRDEFIEAAKSFLIRYHVPGLLRTRTHDPAIASRARRLMPHKQVDRVFKAADRRLRLRLAAGIIAQLTVLHLSARGGAIVGAPDLSTLPVSQVKLRAIVGRALAGVAHGGWRQSDVDARAWKPSLRVLHLALPLVVRHAALVTASQGWAARGDWSITGLLTCPVEWLPGAVADAESWREYLQLLQYPHSNFDSNAICLTPENLGHG